MSGMKSMFSNFTNFDTTYQQNPFQPNYPQAQNNSNIQQVNVNKPFEILNDDGSIKGYFWYFGNSVNLEFDIDGEVILLNQDQYITIEDILSTLELNMYIYDFRMEPILHFSNNIGSANLLYVNAQEKTVTAEITHELSQKLIKGKYYIELVANHKVGYNETLFSANTCVFEVR